MKTNEDTIDGILAELSETYQGQFKLTDFTVLQGIVQGTVVRIIASVETDL